MSFNYEEVNKIVESYNKLTKENLFNALGEAMDEIESLKDQNEQLSQGFEYWEVNFNKLKKGINEYKDWIKNYNQNVPYPTKKQ